MSVPDVAPLLEGEPPHDQVVFATRLHRYWPDLLTGLAGAYPDHAPEMAHRLVEIAARNFRERSADLRLLDLRRHADPDWFQHQQMLGYATYADLFGGTLQGRRATASTTWPSSGVTYLHLMPLLKPRPGQNDGGYAVMDYRAVREDLGTIDDLRDLATTLRAQGISLTLDLVLNHVAAEHQWAVNARAGDRFYRDYFYLFADRELPDAYERSLPEVFPGLRAGQLHLRRGVRLLGLDHLQQLAVGPQLAQPRGVLRVRRPDPLAGQPRGGVPAAGRDRVPLQADGHQLPEPARGARDHPGAAGGRPDRRPGPDLQGRGDRRTGRPRPVPGVGKHAGKVSDLAYQNSLMVQIWSALAAKDTRLFCAALNRFPAKPPTTVWGTYLRCHDDIGWAISDEDAASVGLNGYEHRRFLADYYAGLYPMSDARGLVFQENLATGDRRISGTAASLVGIESALQQRRRGASRPGHPPAAAGPPPDARVRRAAAALHGRRAGPAQRLRLRRDRRARRRQPLGAPTADALGRRRAPAPVAGRVEHRVWHGIRHAIAVRAALPSLDASTETEIVDPVNPAVLVFLRHVPGQTMVGVYNLTVEDQLLPRWVVPVGNWAWDALTEETPLTDGPLRLTGYQTRWFVQQT